MKDLEKILQNMNIEEKKKYIKLFLKNEMDITDDDNFINGSEEDLDGAIQFFAFLKGMFPSVYCEEYKNK